MHISHPYVWIAPIICFGAVIIYLAIDYYKGRTKSLRRNTLLALRDINDRLDAHALNIFRFTPNEVAKMEADRDNLIELIKHYEGK